MDSVRAMPWTAHRPASMMATIEGTVLGAGQRVKGDLLVPPLAGTLQEGIFHSLIMFHLICKTYQQYHHNNTS